MVMVSDTGLGIGRNCVFGYGKLWTEQHWLWQNGIGPHSD